ncbi:MAG: hypothetical protein L0G94_01575 [Brachybacterium sp.]|uniref:hypothetical protein n=1 Tax=Brachybacterium sp. TaxID=1891286 RepID=UPI0026477C3A|nr:hypothetical protein [Brachybacterium sp.]MDN5685359.1 hypothetical protein [Brachybacterium sp.]
MPKKKHRRGPQRTGHGVQGRGGRQGSAKHTERDRRALLAQFVTWRADHVSQETAENEASHVETLLALKGDQLESPDPTSWTEQLIEVLFTQVVPRKVIQPRELAMEQVPALSDFFSFLHLTGRWSGDGIDVNLAHQVLSELEFEALEAADDPSRRSFTGNILTYAATRGVTLEDQDGLADFMEWYNSELTDAERRELTDTGQLSDTATPYTPGHRAAGASGGGPSTGEGSVGRGGSAFFKDSAGGPEPFDALDGPDTDDELPDWPWFLPDRDEELGGWPAGQVRELVEDPAALAAQHEEIPLVRSAARLLEFVREGRQVTATGALRRADVRTVVEDWGIDVGPRPVTTMWQVPEIVGPWIALVSGGWIEVTSTRARAGTPRLGGFAPAEEDPEAFTLFARAVLSVLLLTLAESDDEDDGLRGGPDTFAALMIAAGPEGLDLPHAMDESPTTRHDIQELLRLGRATIDLHRLSGYGLLYSQESRDGRSTHYAGNLAVFLGVTSVIGMLQDGVGSE